MPQKPNPRAFRSTGNVVTDHIKKRQVKAIKVTAADRESMVRIYKETGNIAEVARRMGWSYHTCYRHLSESGLTDDIVVDSAIGPPKPWDELTPQQKGWLTNFAEFRRHFFRRETPPFHVQIASTISSREHSKIEVLCPPGHGKSQAFSVDYPIWEMIRQRAIGTKDGFACMLISKSGKMAEAFLSQIKRELEQNDALIEAFGRFKPEYPDTWKRDMLTVEGFPNRKEPTFIAAGAGSHIYGWRVHLIIADDIVDGENSKTPEAADKLAMWYADELESRLEPGGVIADVGTRFAIFDLHGKIWRQRDDDGNPIYYPIIYRAHDDALCVGEHCQLATCKERCEHDKPYPDGCVLWPGRFSYQKLRRTRAGQVTSARFEFIYNQYEVPDEGGLVKPEWVEKCKNENRLVWDVPDHCRVICTIDPSPTQYAVAQAWGFSPSDEKLYLIAQYRKRNMQAPEYISLIRDWTLRLRQRGKDPLWVVEINAAQRWLLQSTEYQQLRYELGITVNPHTTGRNKLDPMYGVQMIGPAYEYQRIDLPWGDGESRKMVAPLINELVTYPAGETDDCVMAEWFAHYNVKKVNGPPDGQWLDFAAMPPYLMKRRELVDMQTGRRQSYVSN